MKIKLKRGYEIDVLPDTEESSTKIVILGNYSKSGYKSRLIVSVGGVAPTVMENHGEVTGIELCDKN